MTYSELYERSHHFVESLEEARNLTTLDEVSYERGLLEVDRLLTTLGEDNDMNATLHADPLLSDPFHDVLGWYNNQRSTKKGSTILRDVEKEAVPDLVTEVVAMDTPAVPMPNLHHFDQEHLQAYVIQLRDWIFNALQDLFFDNPTLLEQQYATLLVDVEGRELAPADMEQLHALMENLMTITQYHHQWQSLANLGPQWEEPRACAARHIVIGRLSRLLKRLVNRQGRPHSFGGMMQEMMSSMGFNVHVREEGGDVDG